MHVQPTLDAEEGFPDGFVERVRLKNVKFASIDESLDSKSKNFKCGSEVDFDIIHRTVVLVDKGSPLLVRQGHRGSHNVPGSWSGRPDSNLPSTCNNRPAAGFPFPHSARSCVTFLRKRAIGPETTEIGPWR